MYTEICAELRNWFSTDADKHPGTFRVSGGIIAPLDFLQDGQYFRIVGSVFNDGVHQYPAVDLTDETFDGAIWAMRLPPDFIQLARDVEEYNASEAAKPSPYTSESFGGYSYTRFTDGNGGDASDWRVVFRRRLNRWRKI